MSCITLIKHYEKYNYFLSNTTYAFYIEDENGTKSFSDSAPTSTNFSVDVSCDNGASGSWDYDSWGPKIRNITVVGTKCIFTFAPKRPTLVEYITTLAQTDKTNLATDEAGNTRYIGKNPNNYVSVDGDIWRIIGVMKNVDDGSGNKEDRVKIIRSESIGGYSWDTSASNVNNGNGVNEWSQADLMKLLNPGYESETVGGSLYWNSGSGTCYNATNNGTTSCDFTSVGIKDKLKTLIGDAVWNTGSNGTNGYASSSNGLTKHFYTYERSDNTGKICSSGDFCNDTVARTTTWTGKVGLMYPSDYGYVTSGGSTTDRAACLNKELYNWNGSSVSDCKNNDWLFNSSYQWTISPFAHPSYANFVFYVRYGGHVGSSTAYGGYVVRPVVYLTTLVVVQSGDGSSSNPFILSEK